MFWPTSIGFPGLGVSFGSEEGYLAWLNRFKDPGPPPAPVAQSASCALTPISSQPGAEYKTNPFINLPMREQLNPAAAKAFSNSVSMMNKVGITPTVNNLYRTSADQALARQLSGPNPAANVSYHQAGAAVDINGTASKQFPFIVEIMQANGFTWGNSFNDPPHFDARGFLPPVTIAITAAHCGSF